MKVRLLTKTIGLHEYEGKSIDEIITGIARISSSRETNELFNEPHKLLRHCISNGHWSVFGTCNLGFEVVTSRAIGRELLRHWSLAPQEMCLSGDTEIYFDFPNKCKVSKKAKYTLTIKDLYNKFHKGASPLPNGVRMPMKERIQRMNIRSFNKETGEIFHTHIKDIFYTGKKELFEIELENNKKIKCSKNHKFFIEGKGWQTLEDAISLNLTKNKIATFAIDASFAVNGIPCYKSLEWMKRKKDESISNKIGLQYIADEAGVSTHCIKKWLKKHGIQYTKKEVSLYTSAWNKGIKGYINGPHTESTKEKMRQKARKGAESNLWKGGVDRSEREKISDWMNTIRYEILYKNNFLCKKCNCSGQLHLHHIVPVFEDKTLAYEKSNLEVLCRECHIKTHRDRGDLNISFPRNIPRETCYFSKIKKIRYIGFEDTYDLEVESSEHCYIANGIVAHNSQRYKAVSEFEPIEIRKQCENNRQSSTDVFDPVVEYIEGNTMISEYASRLISKNLVETKNLYLALNQTGVAKECARMILPETTQTTLYFNGKIRDWITTLNQRLHKTAQKECRLVAEAIRDIFIQECPIISKMLFNFEDAYDCHVLDRVLLEKYGVYHLVKENNFKKLK